VREKIYQFCEVFKSGPGKPTDLNFISRIYRRGSDYRSSTLTVRRGLEAVINRFDSSYHVLTRPRLYHWPPERLLHHSVHSCQYINRQRTGEIHFADSSNFFKQAADFQFGLRVQAKIVPLQRALQGQAFRTHIGISGSGGWV